MWTNSRPRAVPKVGGFEMLRKMRNEDVLKTTKVVIMTGDKDQVCGRAATRRSRGSGVVP